MRRFKYLSMRISNLFFFVSLSLTLFHYFSVTQSTLLTITNNCDDAIWPIVSPPPNNVPAGFSLSPGCSQTLTLPESWSGLTWARTRCAASIDHCATGYLISGAGKPSPTATTAEFGSGGEYSVSVENGYNLPIAVVPSSRSCAAVTCSVDYGSTAYFPPQLRVVAEGDDDASESVAVGIKSSCSAPAKEGSCNGEPYSEIFKKLCPQARSSSGDIGTVLCCQDSDFTVHFCGRAASSAGSVRHADDNHNIFGMNNLEGKLGIIIGVVVGIFGMVLIMIVFIYWKNECEPWTFSCCDLFACTCCLD